MQPLYMLQAVDVRRDGVESGSRATTMTKLTIPKIEFLTATHNPGGGVGEVEYGLPRIKALEPAFGVKGLDTDVFGTIGEKGRWVLAAAFKDKNTGGNIAFRGLVEGVITDWEPDEGDPAEFMGCNHIFKEVTHFEMSFNGKELWYIDHDELEIRRNGISLTEGLRGALGV